LLAVLPTHEVAGNPVLLQLTNGVREQPAMSSELFHYSNSYWLAQSTSGGQRRGTALPSGAPSLVLTRSSRPDRRQTTHPGIAPDLVGLVWSGVFGAWK
jgi:hypothetical protein